VSSLGLATDRLSLRGKPWDCSMYRGVERILAPRRKGPYIARFISRWRWVVAA
jgi:hypothetical protein